MSNKRDAKKNAINKTLRATKQGVMESIGKVEVVSESTSMRVHSTRLDENKGFVKEFLKRVEKTSKQETEVSKEGKYLSDLLSAYNGRADVLSRPEISDLISALGDTQGKIERFRESKVNIIIGSVQKQLEELLKDMSDAETRKKKYDRERKNYDALLAKLKKDTKHSPADLEGELKQANAEVQAAERDTLGLLMDVNEKTEVLLLMCTCKLYSCEHDYHKRSFGSLEEQSERFRPMNAELDDRWSKYTMASRGRQATLLQAQQEAEPKRVQSIFDISLEDLVARDREPVPRLILEMCEFVRERAIREEGVFRLSADKNKLEEFKTQVDSTGKLPEQIADVHEVTALLKQWLRQLPVPLLTFDLHTEITALMQHKKDDEAMKTALVPILRKLPLAHTRLLYELCVLMHDTGKRADVNKMTYSNLAVVIGPNILYPKDSNPLTMMQEMQKANVVSTALFRYVHEIWPAELLPAALDPQLIPEDDDSDSEAAASEPTSATPSPRVEASTQNSLNSARTTSRSPLARPEGQVSAAELQRTKSRMRAPSDPGEGEERVSGSAISPRVPRAVPPLSKSGVNPLQGGSPPLTPSVAHAPSATAPNSAHANVTNTNTSTNPNTNTNAPANTNSNTTSTSTNGNANPISNLTTSGAATPVSSNSTVPPSTVSTSPTPTPNSPPSTPSIPSPFPLPELPPLDHVPATPSLQRALLQTHGPGVLPLPLSCALLHFALPLALPHLGDAGVREVNARLKILAPEVKNLFEMMKVYSSQSGVASGGLLRELGAVQDGAKGLVGAVKELNQSESERVREHLRACAMDIAVGLARVLHGVEGEALPVVTTIVKGIQECAQATTRLLQTFLAAGGGEEAKRMLGEVWALVEKIGSLTRIRGPLLQHAAHQGRLVLSSSALHQSIAEAVALGEAVARAPDEVQAKQALRDAARVMAAEFRHLSTLVGETPVREPAIHAGTLAPGMGGGSAGDEGLDLESDVAQLTQVAKDQEAFEGTLLEREAAMVKRIREIVSTARECVPVLRAARNDKAFAGAAASAIKLYQACEPAFQMCGALMGEQGAKGEAVKAAQEMLGVYLRAAVFYGAMLRVSVAALVLPVRDDALLSIASCTQGFLSCVNPLVRQYFLTSVLFEE